MSLLYKKSVLKVNKNDYTINRKEVIKIKFNVRLKELRLEKGETQKELAKCLEIGRTTVSEYESGKIVPKQEGLLKIANHFDVSVDYLTGVSNERATHKENVTDLDALLNSIHHILLNEYNTPVTYEGQVLSHKHKLIIDGYIEHIRDNIELLLQLSV